MLVQKRQTYEQLKMELARLDEHRQFIIDELRRLEGEMRLLEELLRKFDEQGDNDKVNKDEVKVVM